MNSTSKAVAEWMNLPSLPLSDEREPHVYMTTYPGENSDYGIKIYRSDGTQRVVPHLEFDLYISVGRRNYK